MENTNDFFVHISKDENNQTLLIETLMKFTDKINKMSAGDLISFYQALKMLKATQPWYLFKKNPVRVNITNTQIVVIQAMEKYAHNDLAQARIFNQIVGGETLNGHSYYLNV